MSRRTSAAKGAGRVRQAWRNRIVESGQQPASEFVAHPDNWRVHSHEQEAVLVGLLDRIGWVQEVLVSRRTGYVLDGHMRVQAALARGDGTLVPFKVVDVTENEEAALLASLDPLAAMAGTDREKLDELAALLPDDLRDLTAALRTERKAARKLVAFSAEEHHRVVVDCASAGDQERLVARLQSEGYTCRAE